LALLRTIEMLARGRSDVAQVWILGSARQPELLDRWSDVDVDVGLVLTGPVGLALLLPAGSVVWTFDRQGDDVRSTCRIVLSDGQRVDLVVAEAEQFERAGGRCLYTSGRSVGGAAGSLVTPDATDANVNEARFVAAAAVVKGGRGDLLIGSHLTLELAQLCLVQAMLLRDRDEKTTSHRFGTRRDDLAAGTWSRLLADDTTGISRVTGLVEQFDRLHAELDQRYVPDWTGLESLVRLR